MARRIALAALALTLATLVAPGRGDAAETIKVGFMAPLSGIFAQAGKDMLEGIRLAFEQIGYQSAGRKIELIEEDSEGNPAVAQAKYRKLVTQDHIHVLTGVLLSNIGYGLIQPIERDQMPTLFLTTPDDLTKKNVSKWILRTNFAASQPMHPLGDYAARTLKYKKVVAIAMDNPFGHEQIGGFQRVFEDAGGRVVQKIWVPLNALDFAPYLTQVGKDADAVCAVFVAAQGVRFIKQYAEYGLKARLPLIGSGVMTDEHVIRNLGDEAVGAVGALIWAPTLTTPANRTYLKLAEARVGRTPAYFTAIMYSAGRWVAEAAKIVEGRVEDRERFLAAIRKASETVEDPRGPIKLDDLGNPTQNVYILKVEKVGGKLTNTVLYTYPMVSQFWTYKADEFLKLPAYSRDYPPARP
ncbi:MAG TPA: ABC transporter substrate-binding protein [Methylomirabilota bacterium]|jgi:branched-chain amino acid transport system substrate-binding protein|nr:ABC transporter substrate-binding protein [Methylomirabilota bacterium]